MYNALKRVRTQCCTSCFANSVSFAAHRSSSRERQTGFESEVHLFFRIQVDRSKDVQNVHIECNVSLFPRMCVLPCSPIFTIRLECG